MTLTLETASQEETRQFAQRLARWLQAGDVILLHGDLGSGKTVVAQGILAGLGVSGPIPSPTFTLVNEYDGRIEDGSPVRLYHLDLYRLSDEADLASIGFDDYLEPGGGISLIEWPERAAGHFDGAFLLIEITPTGNQQRRLQLAASATGTARFGWLKTAVQAL